VAACSPTLEFKPRIDAVEFFWLGTLSRSTKPAILIRRIESRSMEMFGWLPPRRVGNYKAGAPNKFNMLASPKVGINVCPIADVTNLLVVDGGPPALRIQPYAPNNSPR
jgi:hypothetical protein